MADTVVNPIEIRPQADDHGQRQAKPAGQPVQRRIVARKPMAKPNLSATPDIDTELQEIRRAWWKYRTIKDRDAVYIYLAAVFVIVMRWQRLGCALKNARTALRRLPNPPQMKPEPFGIMIFCTADLKIVDGKTRSKWSRVLRYAARAKPTHQRLVDFVKSNDGLNECARKFARIAG